MEEDDTMTKDTDAKKGVEAAWDFWLSQHDVSVPDIIEMAIKETFGGWLAAHTDDIMARVHAALPTDDLGAAASPRDAAPPPATPHARRLYLRPLEDMMAKGEQTDRALAQRMAEGAATWGNWRYIPDADAGQLALSKDGQPLYEVDLAQCTSAGEIFDVTFSLDGKDDVTPEDLGQLVRALWDILRPDGWSVDPAEKHDVAALVARTLSGHR